MGDRSRGRYATPADFLLHDGSPVPGGYTFDVGVCPSFKGHFLCVLVQVKVIGPGGVVSSQLSLVAALAGQPVHAPFAVVAAEPTVLLKLHARSALEVRDTLAAGGRFCTC